MAKQPISFRYPMPFCHHLCKGDERGLWKATRARTYFSGKKDLNTRKISSEWREWYENVVTWQVLFGPHFVVKRDGLTTKSETGSASDNYFLKDVNMAKFEFQSLNPKRLTKILCNSALSVGLLSGLPRAHWSGSTSTSSCWGSCHRTGDKYTRTPPKRRHINVLELWAN